MRSGEQSAKTVVVVGAGFAGLAAGMRLREAGVRVQVLEAGPRAGGRARSEELGALGKIELGATWLHGIEGHPVYDTAVALGLMPPHTPAKKRKGMWGRSLYVREGEREPLRDPGLFQAVKASHLYAAAVEAAVEGHQGPPGAGPSGLEPVGAHLRRAFQQALEQGALAGPEAAEGWAWRERLQRAIDGCATTDDYSLAGLAAYEELAGPNLPLPCGYQAVAEHYAEGLDVLYGHRVQRVEWGGEGVALTCTNGACFACAAAIITVSLGVLQAEHRSLFSPPLPQATAAAIEALKLGVVEKLFLHFPPPAGGAQAPAGAAPAVSQPQPGHERASAGKRLSGQEAALRGPQPDEGNGGEAADAPTTAAGVMPFEGDATGGERPVVSYQLLFRTEAAALGPQGSSSGSQAGPQGAGAPEDLKASRPGSDSSESEAGALPAWTRGVYSIRLWGPEFLPALVEQQGPGPAGQPAASAPAEGGGSSTVGAAPALEAPAAAAAARSAAQAAGSKGLGAVIWLAGREAEEVDRATDAEVAAGVGALLRRFPAISLPRGGFTLVRSAWGADPLFRGSYSYVPAGHDTGLIEALQAPCCDRGGAPRLLLAGEATHARYFGTVHGAYFSGERAARQLLDSWGGMQRG